MDQAAEAGMQRVPFGIVIVVLLGATIGLVGWLADIRSLAELRRVFGGN